MSEIDICAEEHAGHTPIASSELKLGLAKGVALAESFGDPETLFNSRDWLRAALEAKGAKINGGGVGCGQADLDIVVDGCRFNVSISPVLKASGT